MNAEHPQVFRHVSLELTTMASSSNLLRSSRSGSAAGTQASICATVGTLPGPICSKMSACVTLRI
jgi:hypothetical protein